VVTYEALACGLPCVVTPAAGSVVREGIEGFVVESRDVELLAHRMEQLGSAPELRARMSAAARCRARGFDWPRYHQAIVAGVMDLVCSAPFGPGRKAVEIGKTSQMAGSLEEPA
jgi:glycosyltransferase involved in cell wall biosynthesis